MRYVRRFVGILILVLALVSVGLAFVPIAKAEGQITPPNITNTIPHNPDIASQRGDYPSLGKVVFLDNFAWQAFVALNWPADSEGNPLSNKKIGQDPDFPSVWEIYRLPQIYCFYFQSNLI